MERRDRSAPAAEHSTSETTPVIMKHNDKTPLRVVAKPPQSSSSSSPLSPSGTSSSQPPSNEMPGNASIPFLDRRHGRMSSDAVIKVRMMTWMDQGAWFIQAVGYSYLETIQATLSLVLLESKGLANQPYYPI